MYNKKKLRAYARSVWIASHGDIEKAKKQTTVRGMTEAGVGNPLLVLSLALILLQICYTAYRFWKEVHCNTPPADVPMKGEPF